MGAQGESPLTRRRLVGVLVLIGVVGLVAIAAITQQDSKDRRKVKAQTEAGQAERPEGGAGTPGTGSDSGDAYDVATVKVEGKKLPVRWDPCQKRISYRVNARHLPKSQRHSARHDTKRAMNQLSAATGMDFDYEGRTRQIPRNTSGRAWYERQKSAEIIVAWVRPGGDSDSNLFDSDGPEAGAGGNSIKLWTAGGKPRAAVGRGYVVLDAKQDKKLRPGFGRGSTRGALLLHELGHVVGLAHVRDTDQMMYPVVRAKSDSRYGAGDRRGLARVGRPAGCIDVPSSIWRQI